LGQRRKSCAHAEHDFARLYATLFHLPFFRLCLAADDKRAYHHETHQTPTSHNDTHMNKSSVL
jgi:hypothetical protein